MLFLIMMALKITIRNYCFFKDYVFIQVSGKKKDGQIKLKFYLILGNFRIFIYFCDIMIFHWQLKYIYFFFYFIPVYLCICKTVYWTHTLVAFSKKKLKCILIYASLIKKQALSMKDVHEYMDTFVILQKLSIQRKNMLLLLSTLQFP